jgi:hypothetical protein
VKLGQVGCTDGNWWVTLGCSGQQQYSNSVFNAVRTLSMVDVVPTTETEPAFYDELSYRQLEQLNPEELQRLFENDLVLETVKAIAA